MPYIKQERRDALHNDSCFDYNSNMIDAGELNYTITSILNEYTSTKGLSYQTINDIIGALEGAKMEYYRRVAAPYENSKIALNGDVY